MIETMKAKIGALETELFRLKSVKEQIEVGKIMQENEQLKKENKGLKDILIKYGLVKQIRSGKKIMINIDNSENIY